MFKKFGRNWLTTVFVLIISLECLMTLIFSPKAIISATYNGVKQSAEKDGISIKLIASVISSTEKAYIDNLYGKSYWIEVLGTFNKIAGKKIYLDTEDRYTVYKMNNGQETWNYVGYDMADYAKNYMAFANDVENADIPLLYIQVPFKIDKYDNQLPYDIKDETNYLADSFLKVVSQNYDTFDLREVIHKEGLDYSSLFYNTDHHWTAKAGLWASGILSQKLIDCYDIELDITHLSEDNYTFTTYYNFMLGSQGKRAGIVYSGLDDFVLIEPTYETKYVVTIPSVAIIKDGAYSETLLFKENLQKDFYNGDPGRVYTGDNYSLMIIENMLATNNTNILLVKDSFSKSVIPSFASTCKKLHVIDLRTFDGSVSKYAVDNNIDIVLVMYNPSVVVDPDFFEFN